MKWYERLDKWVNADYMGRTVELTVDSWGQWTLAVVQSDWFDGLMKSEKRFFDGDSPKEAVQKFLDSLQ